MTSSIPAKRKKKMIFGAFLGAIVLALTITWLELFSVLATDVDDLRVLMPDDLDFLIEIRDVPGFVDGLKETGFYSSLDTNDAFQSWWRSPEIRTDPAVVAIQQAWEQLKNPTVELPMGLELVPDITGTTLVVVPLERHRVSFG